MSSDKQAKRLNKDGLKASTRRAFVKLFTTAKNGLGITTGITEDQSRVRFAWPSRLEWS
jgi:hypothetical protein